MTFSIKSSSAHTHNGVTTPTSIPRNPAAGSSVGSYNRWSAWLVGRHPSRRSETHSYSAAASGAWSKFNSHRVINGYMSELFTPEFFDTLTERQIAMLRVLLDNGGKISHLKICADMRQEYGVEISDDGLNGVIAGITKKHGEETVERIFRRKESVDMGHYRTTYYMLSDACKEGLANYVVNELGADPARYALHLDSWI